jgi:hypothetical protein
LPCDSTHWVMEDDAHSFWLHTTCGLVRIASSVLEAWGGAVDKSKDAKRTVHAALFDSSDGVRYQEDNGGYTPHAAKSTDGKLSFLRSDGVSERTRIARDLHDTLLQSLQGVLLKFHAVTYQIPDRPEASHPAGQAGDHRGPRRGQGLRSPTILTSDLSQAMSKLGEELAAGSTDGRCSDFWVQAEGKPTISLRPKPAGLRARRYAMHSGMQTPRGSKWKSGMIHGSFGCGSWATEWPLTR